MTARALPILLLLATLSACAAPRLADRIVYDPPRWDPEPDLLAKARLLETSTLELVDEEGLLLYWSWWPWDGVDSSNYRVSHNLADATAWQGYLIAAFGFKAAVLMREQQSDPTGVDHAEELRVINAQLRHLAGAYHYFYRLSGEPGLFGNSMLPGYQEEEPLPWMPPEVATNKPWVRSDLTGEWWRDGVNKGHLNLSVFGCAVPLALHRQGIVTLEEETELMLRTAMVPMVRRLVAHDYRITNRFGKATEHSDLGPNVLILPNPFNRMLTLHMLASAAPYDEELAAEYERRLRSWGPGIGWSCAVSGAWSKLRGRWNRWMNISSSDTQAFALAACSLLMQEERPEFARHIIAGLEGWWEFMQYELNAPYSLVYARFAEESPERRHDIARLISAELRDFPTEKPMPDAEDLAVKTIRTPGVVQPIANRPIEENYWKAGSYVKVTAPVKKRPWERAASMDYLLAYWMGRYFDVVETH